MSKLMFRRDRFVWILVNRYVYVFACPVSIRFLTDAVRLDEDLVDRFGCWIVDLGDLCGFGDVHALLVDEIDQLLSLLVGDWFVFFSHLEILVCYFFFLRLLSCQ